MQKFSSAGEFLASWGGDGDAEGQLHYPAKLTIGPDGKVYVADAHNSRIQKFEPDGRFLSAVGTAGTWQGQFHDPVDVVVSQDGRLHVADSGNRRVQRLTAGGEFLAEWSLPEQQGEKFQSPAALARDARDSCTRVTSPTIGFTS